MKHHIPQFLIATALTLSVFAQTYADDTAPANLAVKVAKIHVGNGTVIEQGIVLIEKGRITAVGSDVAIPDGIELLELNDAMLTPGLIDANARIESANQIASDRATTTSVDEHERSGDDREEDQSQNNQSGSDTLEDENRIDIQPPKQRNRHVGDDDGADGAESFGSGVSMGGTINEQSSEVVPHTGVLDAMNLRSTDFERLVRGGVTTVYASPDASAVIGPKGTVLHTGGPVAQRVLVPSGAVKAVIGTDPSSLGSSNRTPSRYSPSGMYARRPNSRMGLLFVFRKAFYDAMRRERGVEAYGADTSPPEASVVLQQVLKGEVPLRIQARKQQDISSAIRVAKEFDLKFTLEEATEAYRCIDEICDAELPVVFGPIYERPSGVRRREGDQSRYHTFATLLEAGVTTALSAQDLREEDGLARQAMYAMRFGASFDEALRAVTLTPAELLGLDEDLGTVEPGKRADLVIWSGTPLAATSAIQMVVIDGKVVVDRR